MVPESRTNGNRTKTYIEPDEVVRLQNAATNLRDRLLIGLLHHSGCRNTEAIDLEVRHIDFAHGTVLIEHLKSRTRINCPKCGAALSKRHAFSPGCGSKVSETVAKEMQHRRMRTLPLDSETLSMLKEYVRRGGPVVCEGKTLVFGISRHRCWQIVRDCARRAGLPDLVNPESGKTHGVSPHRLRDAFVVRAIKLDDSADGLRLLQQHLGHASFSTTARYRKVSGEEHRDWYDRLWNEDGKAPESSGEERP